VQENPARAGKAYPDLRPGNSIIVFGIACCAWAMVVVAAVALALR
jgi:hypothetical protein